MLKRLRLIAGETGSFRLQIARLRPSGKAKVLRNGPRVRYQGQQQANWDNDDYEVETFKVNLPIKAGQRLAIKTKKTSALRCSSGGPNTLLYTPPLAPGGGLTPCNDTDGCWMLLEGVVK